MWSTGSVLSLPMQRSCYFAVVPFVLCCAAQKQRVLHCWNTLIFGLLCVVMQIPLC